MTLDRSSLPTDCSRTTLNHISISKQSLFLLLFPPPRRKFAFDGLHRRARNAKSRPPSASAPLSHSPPSPTPNSAAISTIFIPRSRVRIHPVRTRRNRQRRPSSRISLPTRITKARGPLVFLVTTSPPQPQPTVKKCSAVHRTGRRCIRDTVVSSGPNSCFGPPPHFDLNIASPIVNIAASAR